MSDQVVILVGNVGREPSMNKAGGLNFSLATNRKWTNKDGSKGEETVWFDCVCWNESAISVIQKYVPKGREVMLQGRLTPATVYQGKDGAWHASYQFNVQKVTLLSGGSREGGQGNGAGSGGPGEEIVDDWASAL